MRRRPRFGRARRGFGAPSPIKEEQKIVPSNKDGSVKRQRCAGEPTRDGSRARANARRRRKIADFGCEHETLDGEQKNRHTRLPPNLPFRP